jgi:hypothetical protein
MNALTSADGPACLRATRRAKVAGATHLKTLLAAGDTGQAALTGGFQRALGL